MSEEKIDHAFKILLSGDTGVGKSSILLQFTEGYFNETLPTTIGVDFKVRMVEGSGSDGKTKKVKITVWDTAGQERFRTLNSSYYRGAQCVVLVYDVARRSTFECLDDWLREVREYSADGGGKLVLVLVGNKIDRERLVERSEGENFARTNGMLFMEASAKTKEGISQIFIEAVNKILEDPELLTNTAPVRTASQISSGGRGGCC